MTSRMLIAVATASAFTSVAALAAVCVMRYVRAADARLWHGVWISLALGSIVSPLATLTSPLLTVSILLGPANPAAPGAGAWIDRLASTADAVAGIAVAGTVFLVVRLALGCCAALRIAREAAPLDGAAMARVDRVLPGVSAICRTHRRVRVPIALGVRLRAIVLPESWREWPDDRVRAILLHERCHVERRDFLWNCVAALHTAVYWWNPVAWLIARRIRLTAELASDRAAAGEGATNYAAHLIATAQHLSHLASPAEILAPGATSNLEARVEAILRDDPHPPASMRRVRWVMALMAALVVLAPLLVQARVERHTPPNDHAATHAERHRH